MSKASDFLNRCKIKECNLTEDASLIQKNKTDYNHGGINSLDAPSFNSSQPAVPGASGPTSVSTS